jgi:hypothetical protein
LRAAVRPAKPPPTTATRLGGRKSAREAGAGSSSSSSSNRGGKRWTNIECGLAKNSAAAFNYRALSPSHLSCRGARWPGPESPGGRPNHAASRIFILPNTNETRTLDLPPLGSTPKAREDQGERQIPEKRGTVALSKRWVPRKGKRGTAGAGACVNRP